MAEMSERDQCMDQKDVMDQEEHGAEEGAHEKGLKYFRTVLL
jgi:hypothetical protein